MATALVSAGTRSTLYRTKQATARHQNLLLLVGACFSGAASCRQLPVIEVTGQPEASANNTLVDFFSSSKFTAL